MARVVTALAVLGGSLGPSSRITILATRDSGAGLSVRPSRVGADKTIVRCLIHAG
jgi:hypothetical protein